LKRCFYQKNQNKNQKNAPKAHFFDFYVDFFGRKIRNFFTLRCFSFLQNGF